MEENKNEILEELFNNADIDNMDWRYTIYREPEGIYGRWYCKERNYVELSKYSPAGEDFSMIIDFDKGNIIESFLDNLKDYIDDFDIDKHVEMWIPVRGKGGCPSSISELVEDAKDIKEMVKELYEKLYDETFIPFC